MDPRERREDETMAEYGARLASMGINPSPFTGAMLGTNYNFQPSYQGGGTLSLGWDKAPGVGAGINFDPSAGLENAYISDYDIQAQGMANVGGNVSPQTNLSLTAGLQGQGLNVPDPYLQAAVKDVVPGLNVYTGTNVPSQATFTSGGLGLSKVSGGPTQAGFATEISPGVTGYVGSGQGGNVGVTASGAWEDIGKTARQLWGGVTDALGNIISPAGADEAVPLSGEPSWDARFPEIAPDFSSGNFDLGSIEALKAHPFGWAKDDQSGMLSYYDTYAGGTPVTNTFLDDPFGYFAREIAPRTLGQIAGVSPTQSIANTGLVNALATRAFFDSPKGWPAGALDTERMMGALTDQGFVDPDLAQSFVDSVGHVRPSDLSVTYDAFGNPSKANISEYMSEIGPIGIAPTNMEITTSGDPMLDAVPAPVAAPTYSPAETSVTPTPVAVPAGPSAADIERQKQAAINARMVQQATVRQQQQQEAARQQQQFDAVERSMNIERERGRATASEVQAAINAMQGLEFGGLTSFPEYGAEPMSAAEIDVAGGMEFGGAGGWGGDR